jgi:DNA invertase Pin-like site-specific DNA recombinase
VRFVAVTQNIETDESNPVARLLMHLMAAFAEFERELIRERVKAGVVNARAKGKQLGRPGKVFHRDQAIEMRQQGLSWRAIARELGVPVTTVRDCCAEIPSQSRRLSPLKQAS